MVVFCLLPQILAKAVLCVLAWGSPYTHIRVFDVSHGTRDPKYVHSSLKTPNVHANLRESSSGKHSVEGERRLEESGGQIPRAAATTGSSGSKANGSRNPGQE